MSNVNVVEVAPVVEVVKTSIFSELSMQKIKNQVAVVVDTKNLTANLIYQSALMGNVSPFKGYDRTMTDSLDSKLRTLIAIAWDKKDGEYKYSRKKASKLINALNDFLEDGEKLSFKGSEDNTKCDFDTFVKAFELLIKIEKEVPEKTLLEKYEALKKRQSKIAEQLRELEVEMQAELDKNEVLDASKSLDDVDDSDTE